MFSVGVNTYCCVHVHCTQVCLSHFKHGEVVCDRRKRRSLCTIVEKPKKQQLKRRGRYKRTPPSRAANQARSAPPRATTTRTASTMWLRPAAISGVAGMRSGEIVESFYETEVIFRFRQLTEVRVVPTHL